MIQNPFCPTLLAPKEMLQCGFGEFNFYEMLLGGWLWLQQQQEDAAEMKKVNGPLPGSNQFVKLPLCA